MNVTAPIRAAAKRIPNATALVRADASIVTYRDLDRMLDAVCVRIAELGLRAGHVVALGILGPDELPGLLTALAFARAGVATADLAIPPARLDAWVVERVPAPPGPRAIPLRAFWDGLVLARPAPPQDDPAAVLRIMSSSGTTGHPKHASFSHGLFTARLAIAADDADAHGPVRIVAMGLGGSSGLRCVLAALGDGAAIVLAQPEDVADAITRHGVTGLLASTGALQTILRGMPALQGPDRPPKLLLEVTGTACPVPLRRLARERLADELIASAGSMECGRLASGPMGDAPDVPMAIKRGVEIRVLDLQGRPARPGELGMLHYRTSGMVPGYDDPALTVANFQGGWFLSGDLGQVQRGTLTLSGRALDLIDSGGVRIAPTLVEDALLAAPGVVDAAAFPMADRLGVDQVWAAIVCDRPVDTMILIDHCARLLGVHAPRHIIQVARLPRTESGKLNRRMIAEHAARLRG